MNNIVFSDYDQRVVVGGVKLNLERPLDKQRGVKNRPQDLWRGSYGISILDLFIQAARFIPGHFPEPLFHFMVLNNHFTVG